MGYYGYGISSGPDFSGLRGFQLFVVSCENRHFLIF